MIQDVIVFIIIATASANVIYQVVKLIIRKKGENLECGGCGQCELKKSIIEKN